MSDEDDKTALVPVENNGPSTGRIENLRPFPKGVSGNPGGRNPEREALRRAMLEKGAKYLADVEEMARSARSEKVRLEARLWLAEKVIGKEPLKLADAEGNELRAAIVILPAPKVSDE